MRLAEAAEQYLAVRAHQVARTTVIGDRHCIDSLKAGLGASVNMSHITSDDLEQFFYGPDGYLGRAVPVAASTFNVYLARVRGFFKYCRAKGWTDQDPFLLIQRKRLTKKDRLRLTAAEVLRCLDLADSPRDRAALAIAANTAMRSSELAALRIRDVDLRAGSVLVRVTKSRLEDWMPITSDLDAELRAWFLTYQEECGPLHPDWYVIPSRNFHAGTLNTRPCEPVGRVADIAQKVLAALGYPTYQEGFHTIRRSVARIYFDMLSADGVDSALIATASLLHHADTVTTLRYIGLKPEEERRDTRLRGNPFLTSLVQQGHVVSIARKV
ncbi:MAG: site-specific integrase [Gemmatimonadota bacterium]|nr:site-specific integrase [Gemmatimonadota bacterium]